jgi:hypothetical protein
MGSRVMHLIIANEIANRITIQDKEAFLLGGIAPDAVNPKDFSHFYIGDVHDFSRCIDYQSFLRKYISNNSLDYVLGYYTHLIADDLWLKGFYLPWLKNRLEQDERIFHLYHNDFRLLNGQLSEYYGVTNEVLKEPKLDSAIDLEEVAIQDLERIIPHIIMDMDYEPSVLDEKLQVFTFNQIVGYVETSVEKGLFHLNQLTTSKGLEKTLIK